MKIFWANIAGALLLTAGALFLFAQPADAQNCMWLCRWEWHVDCTVTPGGTTCTDGQLVLKCRWDCGRIP